MKIPLDEQQQPERALTQPYRLRFGFPPSFTQVLGFSRVVELALQPRGDCLLWITGHNIWPSSENYQLYYRWRQSYGDVRLLHEAPGHLCLGYEKPEVITLVYLCVLFGWDVHLLPIAGYARAFISHDEWAEVDFDHQYQFDEMRQTLEKMSVKVIPPRVV